MAIVSLDHVIEQVRKHKYTLYTIKDGGNLIALNDEKGMDIEEVISSIQATVAAVERGEVDIAFYKLARSEKMNGGTTIPEMKFKVAVPKDAKVVAAAPINGVLSADLKSVLQENFDLKLEVEKMKFKHELELIRREIKEAKNDDGESDGIGAILKPYIPQLLPLLIGAFGGKQGVAGINGTKHAPIQIVTETMEPLTDTIETTEEQEPTVYSEEEEKQLDAMIDAACAKLVLLDDDFHNTITKIAAFAEKHPEQYSMYLKMLPV